MYLVPQVVSLLKTMGVALPTADQSADFRLQHRDRLLAAGVRPAGRLPSCCSVSPSGAATASAYLWDYAKLRLPVIGPILQKIIMARFANFFALMYQSGITMLDAIKTSEDIVGNRVIADGLMRAGQQITAGESLTETFQNLGMFPPLVIRMLRVGETHRRARRRAAQRHLFLQPRRARNRWTRRWRCWSRP